MSGPRAVTELVVLLLMVGAGVVVLSRLSARMADRAAELAKRIS